MKIFASIVEVYNKYRYILTVSQKRWGIFLFLITIGGAFFETLGISIILPLVQVLTTPQQLYQYGYISTITDMLDIQTESGLVWLVGIAVIGVYIIKNCYLFLLAYARAKYGCKIQRELSIEMMQDYMKRGYLFFTNITTGELLRGMMGSIASVHEGLYQSFKLFAEVFTVLCIVAYVMLSDLTMAIGIVVLAIFCLFSIVMGFQKWTQAAAALVFKYDAIINKILLQAFQGIKEVLVMGRQKYFVDIYSENYTKRQKGHIWKTISVESPAYFIEAICVFGLIIIVCIKAVGSEDTTRLISQLATFAVAAFRILPSLGRISSSCNSFVMCIPGINETFENFYIVRQKYDRKESKNEKISLVDMHNVQEKIEWKTLEIKDISWKYPDGERYILKNVSMIIKRGTSIAFVGSSGAGKTTFADIILGLYEPQEGSICIDQTNVQTMKKKWEKLISFVPQNVYLLDDTIRNNIAFGISEDEICDDKILKAIEQAQLKLFVEELPNGINTEIGESGMRLSGGQRQRIAIARALYNDPDILVLDEATSALDSETESAVMEAIDSLQGQKTLIIIAHRLTTVRNCDKIYEIKDGKAIETTCYELIK